MDTTNILPLILPKMRRQMHTKGITSLDEIYMTIAGNAPKGANTLSKFEADIFWKIRYIFKISRNDCFI